MNKKRPTLRHIIKFSKLKEKENIESSKSDLLYSRKHHKSISGFLQAETLQPRKELDDILKFKREEKHCQPRIFYSVNLSFRIDRLEEKKIGEE